MTILVAPTEPIALKAIGTVSSLPELRGCDVMWSAGNRLIGLQRKASADLVSSIYNGRINHEFEKMASLAIRVLVIEGKWKWDRDGNWTDLWSGEQRWTKTQMWSFMASAQARGFWVVQVDDIPDTIEYVLTMYSWSLKDKHTALDNAPLVPKADRRNWILQVLCPGIGPELSKALIAANGDRLPLRLTMTDKEVLEVKGWGPKRVKQLMDALREKSNNASAST